MDRKDDTSLGPLLTFEDLRVSFKEASGVYPVREDSLLLARAMLPLLEQNRGELLDMGCGTGLISLLASSRGWNVTSADRNPRALALTRYNLSLNGSAADFFLTDLFSGIPGSFRGRFDVISFNPPYLPVSQIPLDPMERIALEGGSVGYESSMSFLEGAKGFIAPDGGIILLVLRSYLTEIREHCEDIGMQVRPVAFPIISDEGLGVVRIECI